MRDILDTLQSSLLLWTLSLIPSNIFHYGALGGASVFLVVYAVHSNLPSAKLSRVYEIITVVEELLTRAKDKCTRDYSFLAESETLLLRVKLSASRAYSQLLEADNMSWKSYLQNIISISHSLVMCERELHHIRTTLLLLMEGEHQRKLSEELSESTNIVVQVPPQDYYRTGVHHQFAGPVYEV
ncbi:hypothetical protein DFH08DRAFT_808640 [Mycena albidolilacea]|uniref:Uncharacterized protein n=1 Tax=Mycena albidolilacea TaxID=1033008 RepID=A0AAD7A2S3_9AGAR|nr:hypothetical protein DFH08DRAFT_808640 [Mycena albidolilacea]